MRFCFASSGLGALGGCPLWRGLAGRRDRGCVRGAHAARQLRFCGRECRRGRPSRGNARRNCCRVRARWRRTPPARNSGSIANERGGGHERQPGQRYEQRSAVLGSGARGRLGAVEAAELNVFVDHRWLRRARGRLRRSLLGLLLLRRRDSSRIDIVLDQVVLREQRDLVDGEWRRSSALRHDGGRRARHPR